MQGHPQKFRQGRGRASQIFRRVWQRFESCFFGKKAAVFFPDSYKLRIINILMIWLGELKLLSACFLLVSLEVYENYIVVQDLLKKLFH